MTGMTIVGVAFGSDSRIPPWVTAGLLTESLRLLFLNLYPSLVWPIVPLLSILVTVLEVACVAMSAMGKAGVQLLDHE